MWHHIRTSCILLAVLTYVLYCIAWPKLMVNRIAFGDPRHLSELRIVEGYEAEGKDYRTLELRTMCYKFRVTQRRIPTSGEISNWIYVRSHTDTDWLRLSLFGALLVFGIGAILYIAEVLFRRGGIKRQRSKVSDTDLPPSAPE